MEVKPIIKQKLYRLNHKIMFQHDDRTQDTSRGRSSQSRGRSSRKRGSSRGGRGRYGPQKSESSQGLFKKFSEPYSRPLVTSNRSRGIHSSNNRANRTMSHHLSRRQGSSSSFQSKRLRIYNYPPYTQSHQLLSFLQQKVSQQFNPGKFDFTPTQAFIELSTIEETQNMVNLSGIKFQGQKLFIEFIGKKPEYSSQLTDTQLQQLLGTIGSSRYNIQNKFLNLDSLFQTMPFCNFSNLFFIQALTKIIMSNCPDVETISANNNNITTLSAFRVLTNLCNNLSNLSIANNQIEDISELGYLCNNPIQFREIILTNNPFIASLNPFLYHYILKKLFPELLLLDGNVIQPIITFALPASVVQSPLLPSSAGSYFEVSQDECIQFTREYFRCYDNDRQNLIDAYNNLSFFSLTMSSHLHRIHQCRPYLDLNRNLLFHSFQTSSNISQRQSLLIRGKMNIIIHLIKLPTTQHLVESFTADSFTVRSHQSEHISLHITGFFIQNNFKISFRRVFLLAKRLGNAIPFVIIQDHLHIKDLIQNAPSQNEIIMD